MSHRFCSSREMDVGKTHDWRNYCSKIKGVRRRSFNQLNHKKWVPFKTFFLLPSERKLESNCSISDNSMQNNLVKPLVEPVLLE